MRQESETLLNWISLVGVVEDAQHAKEEAYAYRWNEALADPSTWFVTLTHLRDTDAKRQNQGVEDVRMKSGESAPEAEIVDVTEIAEEVEESVAESGGCDGGGEKTPASPFLKVAHECGIEETVDQQFLEIVVVAVPELGQRPR